MLAAGGGGDLAAAGPGPAACCRGGANPALLMSVNGPQQLVFGPLVNCPSSTVGNQSDRVLQGLDGKPWKCRRRCGAAAQSTPTNDPAPAFLMTSRLPVVLPDCGCKLSVRLLLLRSCHRLMTGVVVVRLQPREQW